MGSKRATDQVHNDSQTLGKYPIRVRVRVRVRVKLVKIPEDHYDIIAMIA